MGLDFVYVLPVNMELGFPQTSFTDINGKYFAFTYRWNSHDDSLILRWVTGSGKVVFQGKMIPFYYNEIKDPVYGIVAFLMMPIVVDKKNIVIYLNAPWLNNTGA